MSFDGGSFVFNESGADKDFRIEGDTEANLFVADASTDRIGIGTAAPTDALVVAFTASSMTDGLVVYNKATDGNGPAIRFESDYSSSRKIHSAVNGNADGSGGALSFHTSSDNSALTRHMIIKPDGKVGIGTSNPAGTFEVQETNTTTYCLQDAYCGTLHVRNKVADASGNNVTTGIKFIVGDGGGDSQGTINLVSCCCNNSLSVMTFATRNVDGTVAEGIRMDGCQKVTISGPLRMGPICKAFGGEGNELFACCEANNLCGRMIITVSEGSTVNQMGIFHLRGLCINGCLCSPYCIYAGGCISAPTKNFEIEHPLASDESPNKYNMMHLVHSTLEGPEYGVYYRGSSQLNSGAVKVDLPEYFEALAEKTDATVQLTPVGGISNLTIKLDEESIFTNNSFCVCTDETGNQTQCFHWIVNGRRIDKHIRCSIGQGDRAGAYDDGRLCTTRWEYRGEMENINGLESMTCAELDDLINFNNTWDSNDPDFVTGYENVSKANKIIMIGNAFDAIQNSAEGGKEDFSEEEEE